MSEDSERDRIALDCIAELLRFAHREPPLSHESVAHMIRGLDAIVVATGRDTGGTGQYVNQDKTEKQRGERRWLAPIADIRSSSARAR